MTPKEFSDALHKDPVAAINAVGEGRVDPNGQHEGIPALMEALMSNETGIVHLLLKQRADPNAYATAPSSLNGLAPIHVTSNPDMIDALIKAHANIDAPIREIDRSWAMRGETAMHIATLNGDRDLAFALLAHGPNINLPFNKTPPEEAGFVQDRAFVIRATQTLPQRLADVMVSDLARREHNQTLTSGPKPAPIAMNAAGLAQMRAAIEAHAAKPQNIVVMHFEPSANPRPSFLAMSLYADGKLAGSLVKDIKAAVAAIQTRLAYDSLQPQSWTEKASSVLQSLNGAASMFMADAKAHMLQHRQEMMVLLIHESNNERVDKPVSPSA